MSLTGLSREVLWRSILSAALCGILAAISNADTIQWVASGGGDWNDASNWQDSHIPGQNDIAFIPEGHHEVMIYGTTAIGGLYVGGYTSSVSVAYGATLNIHGNTMLSGNFRNYGRVNWFSGTIRVNNSAENPMAIWPENGVIENKSGAVFDIRYDGEMVAGYGREPFNNAGAVIKSAGAGAATIRLKFTSSGTMDAQAGTILLKGGGDVGGRYQAEAPAAIHFDGGAFTLGGAPDFRDGDEIWFTGGTIAITAPLDDLDLRGSSLDSGLDLVTGTCTMLGGSLSGVQTISCTLEWQGGTLERGSSLTVLAPGTLRIINGLTLASELTNAGTIDWQSGNIFLQNDGTLYTGNIVNSAGGVFDIQCTQDQQISSYWGSGALHNEGAIRKRNAGCLTTFNIPVDGEGSVRAYAGGLHLKSGSDLQGSYQADAGATISFSGGAFTLSHQPDFTGPGLIRFTGGTLTIIGPVDDLTLDGAVLLGGLGYVTGTFNVNSGSISGAETLNGTLNWYAGTLNSGASLTVTTGHSLYVRGDMALNGALINQDRVFWESGKIWLAASSPAYIGTITNEAGAVFEARGEQWLASYDSEVRFHNSGVLRKTQGANTTYLSVYVDGTGTVDAQQGLISFEVGCDLTQVFQASLNAAIHFQGGTYVLDHPLDYSGAGNVWFTGGKVTLSGALDEFELHGSELVGGLSNVTQTLWMYAGSISGTQTLDAALQWYDGSLRAGTDLTVSTNGMLAVNGWMTLNGCSLHNRGSVVWKGGGIVMNHWGDYVSEIWNEASGLFDIQCDMALISFIGGEIFHNEGTLRKSAGTGASYLNIDLEGVGTVDVTTGLLYINRGCDLAGTYNASGLAGIRFSEGLFMIDHQPAFNDRDHVWFSGGQVSVTQPIDYLDLHGGSLISGLANVTNNFHLYGGSIAGVETLSGSLYWHDGALAPGAALTVSAGSTLNVVGGGMTLYGALHNEGTVLWQSGGIVVNNWEGYTGAIWNEAGGLFDIQCDQWMTGGYGAEQFHNAGTLRKSAGAGGSIFNIYLEGVGRAEVQSGTLYENRGCSLNGTYQADDGAAIHFDAGAYSVVQQPDFQGAEVWFTGGQVSVLGPVQNLDLHGSTLVSGLDKVSGDFHLYSGKISGDETLTGNGYWHDGTLLPGASLTVPAGRTLRVVGDSMFVRGELHNAGTIQWQSGEISVGIGGGYSGEIWNASGALFDIQCDAWLYVSSGLEQLHNAGTLRKSAGTGTTALTLNVDGAGVAEALTGTLWLGRQYAGAVTVGLAGTAPGTGYGRMQFSQVPAFSGNLTVTLLNGFQPAAGDSFTVLNYPAPGYAGVFSSVLGLELAQGLWLEPQVTATSFTLSTLLDLPRLNIAPDPGGKCVSWPLKYTGWTLEASSNLLSWAAIPAGGNNSAVVPLAEPKAFFRLTK